MSMSTKGRLIRWPEVATLLNKTLSRSSVYRLETAGKFPQRVQLGTNTVAWWENEIVDWLDSRARGPLAEHRRCRKNVEIWRLDSDPEPRGASEH